MLNLLTKEQAIDMFNRVGLLVERIKFDSTLHLGTRAAIAWYDPDDMLEKFMFAIESDDSETWTELSRVFGLSPEPKGAITRFTN